MIVCIECGSHDIEHLEWRKVNTGEFSGEGCREKEDQWCCSCEDHVEFIPEEEYLKQCEVDKDDEGYQTTDKSEGGVN